MVAIKDRAVYDFIRAWAIANKFGDFSLGLSFTTNNTEIPATFQPFNKSIDYYFDDERDKFGHKECSYLKKGISYKPRDISCSELLEQVCQWNRPTYPDKFFPFPTEPDGRTCYAKS